jgi:hypothetical protein
MFRLRKPPAPARQPRMETLLAYKDVIEGTMPGERMSVYENVLNRASETAKNENLKFDYEIYSLAYTLFASIPEERAKYTAEQLLAYLEDKAGKLPPDHKLHHSLNRLFPVKRP